MDTTEKRPEPHGRFMIEQDKLDALKRKEKHQHSAVASSEVKQRLQEFVLSKRQREAAAASASSSSLIGGRSPDILNVSLSWTSLF